ncbi:PREDICTED: uncharacterized protein LOC104822056 [Tarenaya hassleriana]|uniref:uncharacterized protein LOC104822056 n=1 Tax=Tarenaya hassleriana TaxID=28532 RepID=UPI00053C3621|nr:PREDICTED: uncharacterized protein LOC104822056 [Tarenaya hassleriana]
MAAVSISLAFSVDPQRPNQTPAFAFSSSFPRNPFLFSGKSLRASLRIAFSPSSHSSSSSSSASTTTETGSYTFLEDSFRTGRFLSNEELEKLKTLEGFAYFQELESGSMWVRVMRPEDMDPTVKLLAESFSESMLLPTGYESVLRFLVKQYLSEKRGVMPHAVTLVGFFRRRPEACSDGDGVGEAEELAGTVEVCFDRRGANASPPSPIPPKDSPYVCNMTVKKPLRRRGIGWHLLKASEELISQMSSSKDVYLHCRMIDSAPFNMYRKAGYEVVKTDNILILLMLQRRKHLMCKKLPLCTDSPESVDMVAVDNELSSSSNA